MKTVVLTIISSLVIAWIISVTNSISKVSVLEEKYTLDREDHKEIKVDLKYLREKMDVLIVEKYKK